MDVLDIPDLELGQWLDELKPYQIDTINVFLSTSRPEEAAKRWISANGPKNTIHFGGELDTKPFWDKLKGEFKKVVCDEKSYAEDRKALLAEEPMTKALLISVVSSSIGATIGYTGTLLAPAVVLLLYTVGKIGKNAYCNNN